MFKTTYVSLTDPGNGPGAIALVQRAKACLEEKMNRLEGPGVYEFDTRSTAAQFTVISVSQAAIDRLPAAIGSTMGHFGQFERLNVFTREVTPDLEQPSPMNLLRQFGVRI